MELSENLINAFADVIAAKEPKRNTENIVYGTVKSVSGKTAQVQFDGAETVTPCVMSMMAEQGDRVRVAIKDHKAVVTGNVSNPATVAKADKYMKFTEDGLVIGGLDDDGDPTGFYILISNDTYFIKDENGNTVASFASSEVNLASGEGTVSTENGTLYLKGTNAVGLRSTKNSYSAEVVAVDRASDPSAPVASMQVIGTEGTSSVIVNSDSHGTVSINTPTYTAYGNTYTAPLLLNGSEIYSANNFFARASIMFNNVSLSAHQTKQIQLTDDNSYMHAPGIPLDYYLIGLDLFEVKDSNGNIDPTVKLVSFDYGFAGVIGHYNGGIIRVYNESSSAKTVSIQVGYFALPKGGVRDGGTTYIDF